MNYTYGFLLSMSILSASVVYTIDECEVTQCQKFNRIKNLKNLFQEALDNLDKVCMDTEQYTERITVGIGLANLAAKGEDSLIITEQILWWRALLTKHKKVTGHVQKDDPFYIQFLAIEKVLIEKITELFKTYNNKQSQQQDVSDVQQQENTPRNCS